MRIAPFALCAGLLVACQRRDQPDPSQKYQPSKASFDAGMLAQPIDGSLAKPTADAGPQAEFSGTVRGIVKLAKGVSLPLAPPVLSHGVTPPSIKPCPPVDKSDQRVVTLSKQTGGVSPIHVALTGMRAVPPREPITTDVFIDACRMRPTIVAVKKGDKVRVTNRTDTALVPQLPGTPFMRGLLRGESQEFEAKATQTKISCSFGSYCGDSLIIATTHTLYDVTTSEGFFTISKVPLDQPVTVHAWHPLFKEVNVKVTLTHEQPEQMVELLLTPSPQRPAPPPPAPGKDGPSKSKVIVKDRNVPF
jgi:hypothetical protein